MQLRLPRSQLTVDELTLHIQDLFVSDTTLKSVVVSGEISEFKRHSSGHCYFTLLGEESRVACAFFKQYAGFVPKWPENGDSVLLEGSVGLYPQRGVYQLYVRRLVPVGAGAIERARQELKDRLEKEGLFSPELKRRLPEWPSRVALITSKTGAAVWDVLRVAGRRFPASEIVLIPAQVQGAEAPSEIVEALSRAATLANLDCVLLVRGGGGREDLVPFDDERVVRAVRSCPVPVVSGVGHDVDVTLCDLAADLRASTPSAAAELVFPDVAELEAHFARTGDRLDRAVHARIEFERRQLSQVADSMAIKIKRALLDADAALKIRGDRLSGGMRVRLIEAREAWAVRAASLDALSPLALMARGFVVCERGTERLTSASEVSLGDGIALRFRDGKVKAIVDEVALLP